MLYRILPIATLLAALIGLPACTACGPVGCMSVTVMGPPNGQMVAHGGGHAPRGHATAGRGMYYHGGAYHHKPHDLGDQPVLSRAQTALIVKRPAETLGMCLTVDGLWERPCRD